MKIHRVKIKPAVWRWFRQLLCLVHLVVSERQVQSCSLLKNKMSGWWLKNHLEKYEIQWEGLSHIFWTIKHVWNHQPNFCQHPLGSCVIKLQRWNHTAALSVNSKPPVVPPSPRLKKHIKICFVSTCFNMNSTSRDHFTSSQIFKSGPNGKANGVFYFWVYFITTSHPPNRVIVLVWSCQRLSFWDCYILGCASV